MALQALPEIPDGSEVFLDANVLIYALGKISLECVTLLQRCSAEKVTAITSFHVIGEVTHRLMIEEARSKGLASSNPWRTLKEHPDRIMQLSGYWRDVERLLATNLLFVVVDGDTVSAAQQERVRFGLMTNDSLIVAIMRSYGISMLATHDMDFERVTGISVYSPIDV